MLLFWYMKNLFITLLALTFTLGVACKKSNDVPVKEIKKELSIPKMANTPVGGGIGGYPGGENTYPHNTGLCYCGQYSVCHPAPSHKPDCPVINQGAAQCTCKL